MIKKVPLPMAGLALAFASLGNILKVILPFLGPICGIVSATLWILVLLKVISYPDIFLEDMKSPIIASSFATFFMAAYLLSGYIAPYFKGLGRFLYFAALILHVVLIIYFSYEFFIKNFDIRNVHASYCVTYIGLLTSAIVSPLWNTQTLAKIFFCFSLLIYLPLFYLVNKRYVSLPEVDDAKKPLFCIEISTPAILLAGYHFAFVENRHIFLVSILCILSLCLYIYVILTKLKTYLSLPFYPSFAALSFPVVINPIAQKITAEYFLAFGYNLISGILNIVWMAQLVLAILVVSLVFIKYLNFLIKA
ncbi:MAG: TDT family transporter [Finegoldia sp.]|nr:TDT family transporter [Finegoldia sp.]